MKRLLLLVMVLGSFKSEALADRRSYVWTYEYLTVPQGETEAEYYYTMENADSSAFTDTTKIKHWLELEHGITDHWDLSIYQTFLQNPGKPLEYEGVKIRTRYRFSERGILPVDPLLYLEYIRAFNDKEDKVEGKIILAKDIWKINISLNLVGELEKAPGVEWEDVEKALLGASFELTPAIKVGGEYEIAEQKAYLGPTVSFASGENWFTIGSRWGLSDNSRDFDLRFIIGIGL